MLELILVLVSSHLMKVVHVKLNKASDTCLTKEDRFECLKYWGNTSYSKALTLWIRKEEPLWEEWFDCCWGSSW